MIHGYLLQLKPSRISLNWEDIPEDILDHPDLPDGHHYVWHHYHSTTFCLRIPKIYDTWVCMGHYSPASCKQLARPGRIQSPPAGRIDILVRKEGRTGGCAHCIADQYSYSLYCTVQQRRICYKKIVI